MARRGYGRLLAHSDYNDAWERISGDLSSSSRPGQLKRGVLEIVVANSTVMQEMAFQKRTLLAQLRADLPEQKIRDLRFVIGALD